MSMIKKTITVTDQQDAWIKSRIASGDYGNDSEFIRDLIRKEQARLDEAEAIRAALIAGEKSGIGSLTIEEIRRKAKARLKNDGRL
ncbi:MAG: type II toxin-antitoxin system ParD family antitoxin [Candidatus Thiodiazotropha sp.]|jgi:antitoxin ParD1/3/4